MSRSIRKTAGHSQKDTLVKKKFNRNIRRRLKQATLVVDPGYWYEVDQDDYGYQDYMPEEQYMSFEISDGKEFRKHNCSYDIRDHHGLWWSYNQYKARLAHWKALYPQWPDFWKDEWWSELNK